MIPLEAIYTTAVVIVLLYAIYCIKDVQLQIERLKHGSNICFDSYSNNIVFTNQIYTFGNQAELTLNIFDKPAQLHVRYSDSTTSYSQWESDKKKLTVLLPKNSLLKFIFLDEYDDKADCATVDIHYYPNQSKQDDFEIYSTEIDLTVTEKDPPKQEGLPFLQLAQHPINQT